MTLEELKAEAKKMGYKLIKDSPYERFLPCTCGCNKRESRFIPLSYHRGIVRYVCKKCGKAAEGVDEKDAKHNWNLMIMEETK